MSRRANPIGIRMGNSRYWNSQWFSKENYTSLLYEDFALRKFIINNYLISRKSSQKAERHKGKKSFANRFKFREKEMSSFLSSMRTVNHCVIKRDGFTIWVLLYVSGPPRFKLFEGRKGVFYETSFNSLRSSSKLVSVKHSLDFLVKNWRTSAGQLSESDNFITQDLTNPFSKSLPSEKREGNTINFQIFFRDLLRSCYLQYGVANNLNSKSGFARVFVSNYIVLKSNNLEKVLPLRDYNNKFSSIGKFSIVNLQNTRSEKEYYAFIMDIWKIEMNLVMTWYFLKPILFKKKFRSIFSYKNDLLFHELHYDSNAISNNEIISLDNKHSTNSLGIILPIDSSTRSAKLTIKNKYVKKIRRTSILSVLEKYTQSDVHVVILHSIEEELSRRPRWVSAIEDTSRTEPYLGSLVLPTHAFKLAHYITHMIKRNESIPKIFKNVEGFISNFLGNGTLKGVLVECKGHLNIYGFPSAGERSQKRRMIIGSTPRFSFDSVIDYSFLTAKTSLGISSIKVWVFYN